MSKSKQFKFTFLAVLALSLLVAISLAAIGQAAPPAGDEQFSVIADATNSYWNNLPAANVTGTNYMDTSTLMALLDDNNDGVINSNDNPANDPLVIDVRAADAYSGTNTTGMGAGHIPGAINITYANIVKPSSLEIIRTALAGHQNKTIVLACYSGHTDKLAEMALGAVAQSGYFGTPAPVITALKWGNLGWNSAAEPGVLSEVTPGTKDIYVHNYGMETTPHSLPAPGGYPVINNTTSTEPAEITRVADDLSLAATSPPFIFPGTGTGQVNDSNIGNYTVVDVRSAADYAAGHITGAVNIPFQQLFAKDGSGDYTNLLSIDTTKPVIVYANGQQESNAAVIGLNALGVRNATTPTKGLRYGLAAWNNNYGMMFNGGTEEHAYPIITGTAPGGLTYDAPCAGGKPSLSLSKPNAYWASQIDYQNHLLSVDWKISNTGSGISYDIAITSSNNSNGVTIQTALPLTVANIMSPAGSATVTLKYNVPSGTGFWLTTTTGSATDICGNSYILP